MSHPQRDLPRPSDRNRPGDGGPMSESAVLDDLCDDDTFLAADRCAEWLPWPYEQPKVLVVEDDDDTREMLVTLLERAGVCVLQASTAAAALRLVASEQVSAVILDV